MRVWLLCGLLAAGLSGCRENDPDAGSAAAGPDAELIALNNRGVALMGRFDYGQAAAVFEQVVARAPDWQLARENLAVATLNRQQPGDEAAALALLDDLISRSPEALRAHYMAGILNFNAGNSQAALAHFTTVAEADPGDAYAQYFSGQSLLQMGQPGDAEKYFARAAQRDPYLRSAAYGLFLVRQQLRDRAGARLALADYEKLEGNPRSRLAEIKYTRMGPRAMALAVRPAAAETAAEPPQGPVFAPAENLLALPAAINSAAILGRNGDGLIALATDVGVKLCTAAPSCQALPPAGSAPVAAAAWGDFDNDGNADLYLARAGDNLLLQGDGQGQWQDVTLASGTAGQGNTVDAAFLDADHDGDLDLLLAHQDGPSELLSNNGDGTFRALDDYTGPLIPARQIIATDLDGDRDLDLVLLGDRPPHQVLINDRLWQYRPAGADHEFLISRAMTAATVVDLDVDGVKELVALHDGRLWIWSLVPGAPVERLSMATRHDASVLWLSDFTGEGRYQALVGGAAGWQLVDLEAAQVLAAGDDRPLAVIHDTDGASLLGQLRDDLVLRRPGPGRLPPVLLSFSGQKDSSQSMRSNASGIGTAFIGRSGAIWVAGEAPQPASAPGQSLQPVLVGTAGGDLDSLAIDWSDGVFQSELDLPPGQLHSVVETQRQLASCPVLFVRAGDGEYRFLTDVLGVGGMGFNTGFGQYAQPRPREALLLPPALSPAGEQLELMLAEPMEESAYVDQVLASVVDLPPGWQVVLDERMGTGQPEVTGELVWYRQLERPVAALDHSGASVLDEILRRDQTAAALPKAERQLLGLLTERQEITLTFERDLGQLSDPVLILDGWVEYGYSQTSFAAWQMDRAYDSVSVDIFHDGQWRSWLPSFGYPAGMPRAASVPLGALPGGVRKLRLSTNQQIYFDRLAVVQREPAPAHTVTPLALREATLRRIGFPRRSNGPQLQPAYDFNDRQPFWDTRYPRGQYTNLGPVRELVEARDNALAIVGPGDGLALEFGARLPPLPQGWSRRWLLTFAGWAKDMDLLTRDGETVGPLPAARVDQDRSAVLHEKYNLRYQQGR